MAANRKRPVLDSGGIARHRLSERLLREARFKAKHGGAPLRGTSCEVNRWCDQRYVTSVGHRLQLCIASQVTTSGPRITAPHSCRAPNAKFQDSPCGQR